MLEDGWRHSMAFWMPASTRQATVGSRLDGGGGGSEQSSLAALSEPEWELESGLALSVPLAGWK